MNKIRNILLIDDDTISSWLNQTMLEKTELIETIETIFDGKSAIDYLQLCCADPQYARTSSPDLILLDLDMPVVNGYDVLDALQRSENCAWLISERIIVLATSINPEDMEKANSYHIYDFLVKPLTDTKIKVLLELFLNRNSGGDLSDQQQSNSDQHSSDREPIIRTTAANLTRGNNKSEKA